MIIALDFLNEVAGRLGWPRIATLETASLRSEHTKLLSLLNSILEYLGGYNDWPMLRAEGTLVLVAALQGDADSSEYVTATQNSDTITVDNATFDETYIGRAFQASGDDYVYRIKAVPAPTQLQLNRAWISASITASDEVLWTIAADRYVLSTDFGREVDDWNSFLQPYGIEPRTPNKFRDRRRENPNIWLGEPEIFTIWGLTNNQLVIHFHPYPENARLLTYEYQRQHPKITSDQDVILYPATYRVPLIDLMLTLAHRDYTDSAKTQQVIADWLRSHNAQQSNPGPTDSRPVLELANDVRRQMQYAYGTPNSVDWGDAFDTGAIYGL